MSELNLKSYIITSRDFPLPPDRPAFPVMAKGGFVPQGRAYVTDATGDNVAHMSSQWAEMTAMYWVWKNTTDADLVSFPHFRRFFWVVPNGPYFTPGSTFHVDPTEANLEALTSPASVDRIKEIMTYTDVIVPRRRSMETSVADQYRAVGLPEWDLFIEGCKALGPEYAAAGAYFDQVNSISCYNMFVMKWAQFDHYMETLFTLLKWVAERVELEHKVPAHMAERFLNLYIHVNCLSTMEVPVALLEASAY